MFNRKKVNVIFYLIYISQVKKEISKTIINQNRVDFSICFSETLCMASWHPSKLDDIFVNRCTNT